MAAYTNCIHESAYGTISVHRTREGAEKAIKEHKIQEELTYYEMVEHMIEEGYYAKDYDTPYIPNEYEDYTIYADYLID